MKIINTAKDFDVTVAESHYAVNTDGSIIPVDDNIVQEHHIEIYVNEALTLRLVCTPDHLAELVVGRIITEGYVTSADEIEKIYICEYGSRAKVFLNKELELCEGIQEEPTCCTDNIVLKSGNNTLVKLDGIDCEKYNPQTVFRVVNEFSKGTKIHRATKGTHSCMLFVNGEFRFFAEDLGRHNALDKVIGYIYLNKISVNNCIVFTTGRVPTDMIKKVIVARLPVIISKAVPTDRAVELAKEYNVVLICKAWPDRYEIFNGGI